MRLTVNNTNIDLFPDEFISLKRVNAEVGKLGSRGGSFTNDFRVPMTAENLEAFGFIHELSANNTVNPESQHEAALFRDTGGQIAKGFVQIVSADLVKRAFNITFYTGNTSWISLLRGKSIRDIWLTDFDHDWTEPIIVSSWSNTDGYIYPIIDYGRLTLQLNTNTFIDDWYPAVFQHTLISRMFEAIGWKAGGSFVNSLIYKKTIIPFVNDQFLEENTNTLLASAQEDTTQGDDLIGSPVSITSDSKTYQVGIDEILQDELNAFDLLTDRYTANRTLADATFVFSFREMSASAGFPSGASSSTATITLQIQKNGTPVESIVLVTASGSGSVAQVEIDGDFQYVYQDTLIAGDYIDVTVLLEYSGAVASTTFVNITWSCEQFIFELQSVDSQIQPGSNVTLSNNLPDIDQADFIKDMVIRHGLLPIPDEYTGTVYFERLSDIVLNLPQSQDLSDYVNILNGGEVRFNEIVSDYGTKNRFYYRSPSDDDEFLKEYDNTYPLPFGAGEFDIINDFVNGENDVYTSIFSPTKQIKSFNGGIFNPDFALIPYIPRVSYDGSESLAANPRILIAVNNVDVNDFTGVFGTININGTPYTQVGWAYFTKPILNSDLDGLTESLAFDIPQIPAPNDTGLLDKYYEYWQRILNKPRYVKLSMRFFPSVFDGLDLKLPVKIDTPEVRGYFLIDTVEFREGEDEITLIQIQ